MTTTKAPPTVSTRLYLTIPGYPLGLCVSCGWCSREHWWRDIDDGRFCVGCRDAVRSLMHWLIAYGNQWHDWLELLKVDLREKWVVAEWLEDHDQLTAAEQLRDLQVRTCDRCKGTGRVRNPWLTVYPHDGDPCKMCCDGEVLKPKEADQ